MSCIQKTHGKYRNAENTETLQTQKTITEVFPANTKSAEYIRSAYIVN